MYQTVYDAKTARSREFEVKSAEVCQSEQSPGSVKVS